jgi:hypothetical protein
MAKTLEQLLKQKQAIDEKIREIQRAQHEAKKSLAIRTLESAGVFDLDEAEMVSMLRTLKRSGSTGGAANV